jgi:hypothetical protein
MSQRQQIVLPDPVDLQLRELAAGADTPPSTLAAQMVQAGVALAAKDGKVRPLRPAPVLVGGNDSERAPWLEPYGGDNEWRQQMWGAVVALHGRYPTQLQTLKDKWWKDESQTETTPKSYASRAAASPRHGSQVRHQRGHLEASTLGANRRVRDPSGSGAKAIRWEWPARR